VQYRYGSAGNADAAFMRALAQAAVSYTDPGGIVLDISKLHYVWGDMLESVFDLGERPRLQRQARPDDNSLPLFVMNGIPQATVIGPDCKDAVRTLLLGINCRPEESLDEFEWLVESFDAAWRCFEDKIHLAAE